MAGSERGDAALCDTVRCTGCTSRLSCDCVRIGGNDAGLL